MNIKKTRLSINTICFDSINLGINLAIDLNFVFWLIFSTISHFQSAVRFPVVVLWNKGPALKEVCSMNRNSGRWVMQGWDLHLLHLVAVVLAHHATIEIIQRYPFQKPVKGLCHQAHQMCQTCLGKRQALQEKADGEGASRRQSCR